MKDLIQTNREFLKDSLRLRYDFSQTDQNLGIPAPPIQKEIKPDQKLVYLDKNIISSIPDKGIIPAIQNRVSHRRFRLESITLEELSFLLLTTQGTRGKIQGGHAFRVVPSAGCRHAFETYICATSINGLEQAIYRYLPVEHAIVMEKQIDNLPKKISQAALGQSFIGDSAAVFVWTCVPYRMEWRYGPCAHKVIALDAGHVCQNLYLASELISCGTCAIAAYNQEVVDKLVGVDGNDEFTIYLAPVGKVT